jgi:hypothetical protein
VNKGAVDSSFKQDEKLIWRHEFRLKDSLPITEEVANKLYLERGSNLQLSRCQNRRVRERLQ